MSFEIEVISAEQEIPVKRYKFITYKTVMDKNGNSVEIEDRVETYSLEDLNAQLESVNVRVAAIQEKIDAINAL